MILVSVIVGYMLGVLPFIVPKIIENKQKVEDDKDIKKDQESQAEILKEWLYGSETSQETQDKKGIDQADILEEYLTGEEKGGK